MSTTPRMLRLPEVLSITGLGRTKIYELERKGLFPKRRKLNERATAWRSDEVQTWVDTRPVADPQSIAQQPG